jgi:hypothetical protein
MRTFNSTPGSGLPRKIATRKPSALLGWLRFLALWLLAIYILMWVSNVLAITTIFNSPEIHYPGIDANTGKMVVIKGCRPERLRPDGSCNKTIDLATIIAAIPPWSR